MRFVVREYKDYWAVWDTTKPEKPVAFSANRWSALEQAALLNGVKRDKH